MKKLFLLATAFVFGFAAMAQQQVESVIKLDMDKYDFGKIKQGVPVTTYFTVTNISDKPVVIENAQAGCGCTTPEWSREPIAPNSTSKIKVGYNAAAPGIFTKQVTVKLAGVDATKAITITGEVVAGESAEVVKQEVTKPEVKVETPVPAKTKTSTTQKDKKSTKKTSSK